MKSTDRCWCGGGVLRTNPPQCADSRYHDPLATGIINPYGVRMLYLAGPMSGLPLCNYPEFNRVASALREVGFTVVNPVEVSGTQPDAHYCDYLRADLKALLGCEGVAVLPGWEHSTGARNEVQVAGLLGMPVRDVEYWLSQGCVA